MRSIGKIILDLLADNHVSVDEAELLITKLLQTTPKSLGFQPKRTDNSYWVRTTTMDYENC